MKRFQKGAIVAMSIFGLMVPEPHSLARVALLHGAQKNRELTFADRVAYQNAIEEVYWRHRIWPTKNGKSKPTLDTVMSGAQIEEKVRDYLRNSQALEDYWQKPITAGQLQAEMDRMASHTKQPQVLRELFDALGNDPSVIAECLARPIVTERIVSDLGSGGFTRNGTTDSFDRKFDPSSGVPASDQNNVYALPEISVSADCTDNNWTGTNVNIIHAPNARIWQSAVWTGSEMIVWGGFNDLNTGGKYNPSTDSWTATSTINAPDGRYYHTAVWTGSEMVIWGGQGTGSNNFFNTGGRYNPSTDSWTATSTVNAPDARASHTAVWTGSEMIIWGGSTGCCNNLGNTGGRYYPITDSWIATTTTNAPAARTSHTAVWTGSEMIVWGGASGSLLNTGGRYDPNTDSWISTTITGAPAGRHYHTAVWTGTRMIVWGGQANPGGYANSGGMYDPGTDSWTATTITGAPAGRYYHTAVWSGSEMIVWGGTDDTSFFNSGGRYDPGTDSWSATGTGNSPEGRRYHTAVWTGSEMVVWGGQSGTGSWLNTGGRYNPSTDNWSATRVLDVPDARSSHTAVWTGSEMIVWGGYNGGFSGLNTGWRYNPSTDSWTATNITGAPIGRWDHTAVWTGIEMIVWGGSPSGGSPVNSGGRYNPSTDSWTATSMVNAPVDRELHKAVWTGNEMIVWGGSMGSLLNTGGRYDPSTDTWAATSVTGAPASRYHHTAVWTGSEMVIWGGSGTGSDNFFNTGGRYNPSTDSWTATSADTAPFARAYHTAVWTGSEMIVWGGQSNPGGYANTGGRYNPSTDIWVPTNLLNAPDGRTGHAAIWTGSEMIVWGGTDSASYFNTGGRYNPSTDGWSATSTTGAPDARFNHTAVWTGTEMIVWGGSFYDFSTSSNHIFNTGGRYCAQPNSPIVQRAVSRKTHGGTRSFDINLPMSGTPGIECRSGGATNDYTIIVTFLANVSVTGNPQAAVTSGAGTIGSGGVSNGGTVTTAGNVVTLPLTNVANAQTISVTLYSVNSSTNVVIPMSILLGDVNWSGNVDGNDVSAVQSHTRQQLISSNFQFDVNASGVIDGNDVSMTQSSTRTHLP